MELTKISGIYKIVNINNEKVYIGSSKDIEKRFKEHIYQLKITFIILLNYSEVLIKQKISRLLS